MDFDRFRLPLVVPLVAVCTVVTIPAILTSVFPNTTRIPSMDDVKNLIGVETCSYDVRDAKTAHFTLRKLLRNHLFGQHLVHDGLLNKISEHLDNKNPSEPLIISLHGPPGSGKSFTAELTAKGIYNKGGQSNFVKFFTASHHFPDPREVPAYKAYIKRVVTETVSRCPRALFVFDEVDKLPAGLLDTLLPFITHPGRTLDGIEYKKAIYLFLGNSGADAINDITWEHKKSGKARQDLKLSRFQDVLSEEALQKQGGWYKSEMIKNIRVKLFIPYLPMERYHVLECFRRLAHDHDADLVEDDFNRMADQLNYWPPENKIFSTTGCKRVENILLYEITAQKFSNNNGRTEF